MNLPIPITLKYFKIAIGQAIRVHKDDLNVSVYQIINLDTGLTEVEGQVLADVYNMALSMDINMQHAIDFYQKNSENYGHLNIQRVEAAREEDPLEGFVLPGEKKLEQVH